MSTIVILGAGALGGALAHKLAGSDSVRDIRLVDTEAGVATGKALDIAQAGPVEGFDTRVSAADFDAVVGAHVIVVTGPARDVDRDWGGDEAIELLGRAHALAPRVPVVCAGATHGPLIAAAVDRLGVDAHQIFGSAPGALVSALQALVALEARVSPGQVAINLLGLPPGHPVVTWSSATVNGDPLESLLPPPQLSRLRHKVTQLWPPGPYTLASSASALVGAMCGGSHRNFTCFVATRTGGTVQARSLTVRLRPTGIDRITEPTMSQRERVELDNALKAV
jgi:malate dehydrogenase